MLPEDFQRISAFFRDRGIPKSKNLVGYEKFIESVEERIKQAENNNTNVDYPLLRQICQEELGNVRLDTFAAIAESQIQIEKHSIPSKPLVYRIGAILESILISIVSSFIFLIILIFIFAVAKDQVVSLLATLGVI